MFLGLARLARLLALSAAVVASVTAMHVSETASAVSALASWPGQTYTRTIEPWNAGDPPAATAVPAVDLTAACVRAVPGGRLEAVFGYENQRAGSILVALAADGGLSGRNVILRDVFRLRPPGWTTNVEELGPQVTLFKPGRDPHAFAVRFDWNERVAWQVNVPSTDGPSFDAGFKVTVRPRLIAPCGPGVPRHFAVVQHAVPTVTTTNFEFEVLVDSEGTELEFIAAYDLEMGLDRVRAGCSAGGQLLEVVLVAGWEQGKNLEPLDPAVDVIFEPVVIAPAGEHGGATFEMTTTTLRGVAAVAEKVRLLGPIADVTARCAFGSRVVESDVFWAQSDGFFGLDPVCYFDPSCVDSTFVKELEAAVTAPGGSRLR